MHRHFSETTAHQRLLYGGVVGVIVALAPLPMTLQSHGLLAWCLGSATYLVLAWLLAMAFDAPRTRERAQAQDQPGAILFMESRRRDSNGRSNPKRYILKKHAELAMRC